MEYYKDIIKIEVDLDLLHRHGKLYSFMENALKIVLWYDHRLENLKFSMCVVMHMYVYHTQEKKSVTSKISRRIGLEIHGKEGFLNFTMYDLVFWIFPTITGICNFINQTRKMNTYIMLYWCKVLYFMV